MMILLNCHFCDLLAVPSANKKIGSSKGWYNYKNISAVLNICHLNIEGLSRAMYECLGKILSKNSVDALTL